MQLYKLQISPVSSFASPLQSDTFFGAFCWSYQYLYGESELEKLLISLRKKEPAVIFSNAFPSGTLPVPIGSGELVEEISLSTDKQRKKELFQKNKEYKSARYVENSGMNHLMNEEKEDFLNRLYSLNSVTRTTIHNMVDRSSGSVQAQSGGASLFDSSVTYGEYGQTYDLYVLSYLDFETLSIVIQNMLLMGIGAKKSSGKGAFTLESFERIPHFEIPQGANAFMALSNFIPAKEDPLDGKYRTFVKYGKLDREYAGSEYPFKKPLLFIEFGSWFYTEKVEEFYGRCVENVAVNDSVIVNGYTIAYPLKI